jgi:hypothetical protein
MRGRPSACGGLPQAAWSTVAAKKKAGCEPAEGLPPKISTRQRQLFSQGRV